MLVDKDSTYREILAVLVRFIILSESGVVFICAHILKMY